MEKYTVTIDINAVIVKSDEGISPAEFSNDELIQIDYLKIKSA